MNLAVTEKVRSELQKSFKFPIKKRVYVVPDIEKFNFKEDLSVWQQKRNISPHYYSVYWDGIFVCGFDDRTPIEYFLLDFWKNFKRMYEKKMIFFDETKYDEETEAEKKEKETIKNIKKIKATTKTERMAKEVVKKLHKKDKNAARKKVKTPIITT